MIKEENYQDMDMKSLNPACKPRNSIFDSTRRDTVLDLTDLIEDRIDPTKFFAEDNSFRQSMVECYRNLTKHMPDNGLQVVMFTHQDASVWGAGKISPFDKGGARGGKGGILSQPYCAISCLPCIG